MQEHIELRAYPFPEGMVIPRLMPFQEFPFNGDGYLAAEVRRLKAAHGLIHAFETGTCLGSTAIWLGESFDNTVTFEINPSYFNIASARIKASGLRVLIDQGDSVECIRHSLMYLGPKLWWLDAHWGSHCPLLKELEAIAEKHESPCIVIHDFQVPGTDFGFDSMPDGRPFNLDLIRFHLDVIYGEGKWRHNYPTKVEGARRGWISIEPA